MPCNSPNKVFYLGVNHETGKNKILFTSRNAAFAYRYSPHDKWIIGYNDRSENASLFRLKGYEVVTDGDLVPCGQCLGCRLDYARQWSARIMAEKKKYPDDLCWFITLTYDDDHLPEPNMIPDKVDEDTGEIYSMKPSPFSSVSKRTHQLFMKRLRKKFQPRTCLPIRFFMSAEYGSISGRCHYHYIIFGLKLNDLCIYKSNRLGDTLYTSNELSSCWSDDRGIPFGFVTIGNVTIDSAGYCARYAIKKRKVTDKEDYKKLGIEPEFVSMSRRPGIGKDYFMDNYETLYLTDEIILPGRDRPIKMKPPKYFDTLLESLDSEKYEYIKKSRKHSMECKNNFLSDYMPFFDQEEQFRTKERRLDKAANVLRKREVTTNG